MTACGGTETLVEPPPAAAASIKVRVVTDTLRQMQPLQMAATASTAAGQAIAAAPITWSSLDDRVATIDADEHRVGFLSLARLGY